MKIIIAPQAFKGSISAMNAAKAIEQGVKAVLPDATTILIPIADGGDGTLELDDLLRLKKNLGQSLPAGDHGRWL